MMAHVSCLEQGKRPVLQCSMQLATSEERNAAFARVTERYATVMATKMSCNKYINT